MTSVTVLHYKQKQNNDNGNPISSANFELFSAIEMSINNAKNKQIGQLNIQVVGRRK